MRRWGTLLTGRVRATSKVATTLDGFEWRAIDTPRHNRKRKKEMTSTLPLDCSQQVSSEIVERAGVLLRHNPEVSNLKFLAPLFCYPCSLNWRMVLRRKLADFVPAETASEYVFTFSFLFEETIEFEYCKTITPATVDLMCVAPSVLLLGLHQAIGENARSDALRGRFLKALAYFANAIFSERQHDEFALTLADATLTSAARRRVSATGGISLRVDVSEWDLEKREISITSTGYGQSLMFKLQECGRKSFVVAPVHPKEALQLRVGSSFSVQITVMMAGAYHAIGGATFYAPPGTKWEQTLFYVRDTYNLSREGVWPVRLHFAATTPGSLLQNVSVEHTPAVHREYIDRMLDLAYEQERCTMLPLLAAQIQAGTKREMPTARTTTTTTNPASIASSNPFRLFNQQAERNDENSLPVVETEDSEESSADEARDGVQQAPQNGKHSGRISPPTPKRPRTSNGTCV
jgi:hypothetical protein